jgi:hypothetical protein
MHHRLRAGVGTLLAIAFLAATAPAQTASRKYGELLKRIPEQSNVLLLVDVDGLFRSPLGQSEGWQARAASQSARGLGLSAEVSKVVVAANLDLQSLDENWKLGMAEVRGTPNLGRLATREGGFVETLQNTPVAWTPRGFYLFSFPPQVIGFVAEADRQALSKWIMSTLVRPRTFPPGFADRAIHRADVGAQIVLALNLTDAVSPKLAEPWLGAQEGVRKAKLDAELLAMRLAEVKSASLQVDVARAMQGTLRIDFRFPVDYAGPVLKELILTVLDEYGAGLPELASWNLAFDANKQAVELSGRLGEESVRRILSVVGPPRLTASTRPDTAAQPAAAPPAEAPAQNDPVRTSQAYFRSVVDLLDGLKQQNRPTYRSMKLWYERYAKQIEELPILGVDQDLLAWGSKVSLTLREMASGINFSAKDQTFRLAASPTGTYDGYGTNDSSGPQVNRDMLKAQSNAKLSVDLDARWQAMQTSIADMRRAMVAKYKVDF